MPDSYWYKRNTKMIDHDKIILLLPSLSINESIIWLSSSVLEMSFSMGRMEMWFSLSSVIVDLR